MAAKKPIKKSAKQSETGASKKVADVMHEFKHGTLCRGTCHALFRRSDRPKAFRFDFFDLVAEERGFEPPVALRLRRFSKPLPSTTRPLLQVLDSARF